MPLLGKQASCRSCNRLESSPLRQRQSCVDRAILKAVETNDPPVHLLLGNDALKLVRDKLNSLGKEIDTWESVTRSTEYA
jgi:hypothetical protein